MTTDTILNMSYIAEVSVPDNTKMSRIDVESIARVLADLLGEGSVANNRIAGVISVRGSDLEAIHGVLHSAEGVDIRIGIARNDALAEVALLWSDRSGITHIAPEDEDTYLAGIPVPEIEGLSVTVQHKMRKFQIYTAYDLKHSRPEFISVNFGSEVVELYQSYTYLAPNKQPSPHSSSWYRQVVAGEFVEIIAKVVTNNQSVKQLANTNLSYYNEPSMTEKVLNLFNYQQYIKA